MCYHRYSSGSSCPFVQRCWWPYKHIVQYQTPDSGDIRGRHKKQESVIYTWQIELEVSMLSFLWVDICLNDVLMYHYTLQ